MLLYTQREETWPITKMELEGRGVSNNAVLLSNILQLLEPVSGVVNVAQRSVRLYYRVSLSDSWILNKWDFTFEFSVYSFVPTMFNDVCIGLFMGMAILGLDTLWQTWIKLEVRPSVRLLYALLGVKLTFRVTL